MERRAQSSTLALVAQLTISINHRTCERRCLQETPSLLSSPGCGGFPEGACAEGQSQAPVCALRLDF